MCNPDSQSWALHASEPDRRGLLDPNTDEARLKPAGLIMGQHHFGLWGKELESILSSVTSAKGYVHFLSYYCSQVTTKVLYFPFITNTSLFLLPAPSSPSPTQPSRASSWQPLHTPRLSVSSRRRKRSNSALALGLNATVAAQPVYEGWMVLHQNNLYIKAVYVKRMGLYLPLADPRTSA